MSSGSEQCPPELYRQLYAEVGPPVELVRPALVVGCRAGGPSRPARGAIRVLHLNGAPAGYYELVPHDDRSVEIGYFGLMPHAIGRGLGRWLLGEAIADAWSTRA